ncbi:alpha-L-rhamnosidase [Klebsiella variicola]|uniref:Alpha-L-rhamnosidase n=1 Tax=Klebsiella variicola TaxID=244366 RepID=A0A7H4MKZ2_KLEVA|nr:alpha-L-rhamnosidase [Klebsiella variicola]
MSQAIQYNSSVAMTRHPHLLERAAALTPALHRQRQAPQAIVEAVADPAGAERLAGTHRLHA